MSANATTILFMVSTLRRTGPTNQLLNIIKYLDHELFLPRVLTLSPDPEDSMWSEYESIGVAVASLGLTRWQGALPRDWQSIVLNESGGSRFPSIIVHTQGIRADGIASRHLTRVPCIATLRNYPYEDYCMKFGRLRGRWMAGAHFRALRALPRVVVCSSNLQARVARHGVKARVIHNGIDIERFQPASDDQKVQARRSLGFDDSNLIVIYAGALVALKDPLSVIRAFRALDGDDLRLVLLGAGPLQSESRKLANGDARIRITGQVSNVGDYLRIADSYVSASLSEGMPNAVLEALACGLPVVLSDIPSHREVLALNPRAGQLVPLGDGAKLEAALFRVLRGDRVAMAGHALELARSAFSASSMSAAYQSLYREMWS